ncbi:MAG TPA: hypothetical protein VD768_08810 [Sphingomicrobium sp.]|nr:hypothetical protein [Sphingomicrobium sp.]
MADHPDAAREAVETLVEQAVSDLLRSYVFMGRITRGDIRLAVECGVRAALASLPSDAISRSGEGEPETEAVVRRALLSWCNRRDDPNDTPARMVRSWHMDLARAVTASMVQCSFCFLPATTTVDDESGPMESCARCAAAWKLDPGFVADTRALSPPPSAERAAAIEDDLHAMRANVFSVLRREGVSDDAFAAISAATYAPLRALASQPRTAGVEGHQTEAKLYDLTQDERGGAP